jgi:hypothetical protein
MNEGSVSEVDAASIFTVEMFNLGELQCMQLYIWLCFVVPVETSAGGFLVRFVPLKGLLCFLHSFTLFLLARAGYNSRYSS